MSSSGGACSHNPKAISHKAWSAVTTVWFIPNLLANFTAYSKSLCTMLGSVEPEGIMGPYPIHVTGTVGVSFVKKAFQPGQWSLSSSTIFVGGERHNCHVYLMEVRLTLRLQICRHHPFK